MYLWGKALEQLNLRGSSTPQDKERAKTYQIRYTRNLEGNLRTK